jgi:hypothetical protein
MSVEPNSIKKEENPLFKEDEEIKKANQELKKKYSIEEYDPKKFVSKAHDDYVLSQIKSEEIKLKNTAIRKRQQTCTFRDLKNDEVKYYL